MVTTAEPKSKHHTSPQNTQPHPFTNNNVQETSAKCHYQVTPSFSLAEGGVGVGVGGYGGRVVPENLHSIGSKKKILSLSIDIISLFFFEVWDKRVWSIT